MFYFSCNESKIYESFTFWNKLQEKKKLFHNILIFCVYICIYIIYMVQVWVCVYMNYICIIINNIY